MVCDGEIISVSAPASSSALRGEINSTCSKPSATRIATFFPSKTRCSVSVFILSCSMPGIMRVVMPLEPKNPLPATLLFLHPNIFSSTRATCGLAALRGLVTNPILRIPFIQPVLTMALRFHVRRKNSLQSRILRNLIRKRSSSIESHRLSSSTDPLSGGAFVSGRKCSAFSVFCSTCWMVTGSSSLGSNARMKAFRRSVPMALHTPTLLPW